MPNGDAPSVRWMRGSHYPLGLVNWESAFRCEDMSEACVFSFLMRVVWCDNMFREVGGRWLASRYMRWFYPGDWGLYTAAGTESAGPQATAFGTTYWYVLSFQHWRVGTDSSVRRCVTWRT
jgi:hypothetical protein